MAKKIERKQVMAWHKAGVIDDAFAERIINGDKLSTMEVLTLSRNGLDEEVTGALLDEREILVLSEKCPFSSKEAFTKVAVPQEVKIGDSAPFLVESHENSTGSFGYYYGGGLTLTIGGQRVDFQAQIRLTVKNSKPLNPNG